MLNNCLCLQIHPDQALLLLVTGALGLRLLQAAMCPVLPVLYTFKVVSRFRMLLNYHFKRRLTVRATLAHYLFIQQIHPNELKWMFCLIFVLQENVWALRWLWDNLSPDSGRFSSLVQEIEQEMKTITGVCGCLPFLCVCNVVTNTFS